jgi:hypothetical protein
VQKKGQAKQILGKKVAGRKFSDLGRSCRLDEARLKEMKEILDSRAVKARLAEEVLKALKSRTQAEAAEAGEASPQRNSDDEARLAEEHVHL